MSLPNSLENWRSSVSNPRTRRYIQIFKIILVLILFISLFYIIPVKDVYHTLKNTNILYFLGGVLFGLLTIYLKNVRLGFLTQQQGLDLSIYRLFLIHLTVKFYLLFVPGTIVGSGIRWGKISSKEKPVESFAAIAFNKLVDIAFIIIPGLFWFLYGLGDTNLSWITIVAFIPTIGILWVLSFAVSKKVAYWIDHNRNPNNTELRWKWFWKYLQRLLFSLNAYGDLNVKNIIYLFSIGILAYLASFSGYILIAYSIGVWLSIINLGWIQAIVDLASITPFSIAGGLGIRDVSLVVLLPLFDIKAEVALAFSMLLLARTIILSLLGGIIEFLEGFRKPKEQT